MRAARRWCGYSVSAGGAPGVEGLRAPVVFTRDIAVAAAADRIVRLEDGRMTALADAVAA
jgi:hypothetical protein